ncbi:MAG: lipoyltransferase [Bacteroidales bacterium]|nr:lipoyltransferase [Bacteroidales bacterium]
MLLVSLPHSEGSSDIYGEQGRRLVFYLAMEEYVAGHLNDLFSNSSFSGMEKELFFIWQVPPTVIFGRNQVMEAEVNIPYCREHGVNLFRRKSGGGCVYSDWGNIMVSCISERTDVAFTFDRFLQKLALALRQLGLNASASGRNDVVIDGRKVSGNAFYLMPKSSIVHGTLLYDSDFDALERAITPSQAKITSKGVASVRQHVVNVKDYLETSDDASVRKLSDINLFKKYLTDFFCKGEIVLSDKQVAEIESIEKTYLEPSFLKGRNTSYNLEFHGKIEGAGELSVGMDIECGKITKVHLSGDYFLTASSRANAAVDMDTLLTDRLRGCSDDEDSVRSTLKGFGMENYIMNMTDEKFIGLIFNR